MTLRASARPFVPVAPAHAIDGHTTAVLAEVARREAPQALGDKLIQDLATRIDGVKRSSARPKTNEKAHTARRSSSAVVVTEPGEQARRLRTSWRKLPAAGLFCPCCITLRPCPFHAVDNENRFSLDLREAGVHVKSALGQNVSLQKTWGVPRSTDAPSSARRKRVLPPPPTEAPPPPPVPPGLEVGKITVLTECGSWNSDRSLDTAKLPSCLLDDASTDVADSEVSSVVSALSSKTRRPPLQQDSGARNGRSSGGTEMEWLPYRSAVWPNSGPRRRL